MYLNVVHFLSKLATLLSMSLNCPEDQIHRFKL